MTDPTNPILPVAAAPAQAGQVNWGDLMSQAGSGFDPLPNDAYEVQVTEAKATSTAKGKTMFKVTFTVTSGPFANRKLWSNLTVSPESPTALGIFFSQMAALGLTKDYFGTGPQPEQIATALVGKYATVTTVTREWGGSIQNDVKTIRPAKPGTALGAPLPQAAAPGVPAPLPDAPNPLAPPKLPF